MKFRILYERTINVLAGGLAMAAQRLPFLKHLSPILSTTTSVKFAAPLAVNYLGVQSLSGQSGVAATLSPVNGSQNPAEAMVGEEFVWSFRGSSGNFKSFKVELITTGEIEEGLPEGLSTFLPPNSPFGYIGGVPEKAGIYYLAITAYEEPDYQGYASEVYPLIINVEGVATPYESFVATFWSGADLENPAVVGATADPDEDGIANVLEFVLDLDPTRKEVMPGTLGSDSGDDTMLRYEIPLNELASDTTVVFEESATGNPADWATVSPEKMERTESKIVLTTPKGPGKMLYRLKVTL